MEFFLVANPKEGDPPCDAEIEVSENNQESVVVRSLHELTCFHRHSQMASGGYDMCPDCGEDLRPFHDALMK